jgi:hypothetical protein
LYTVALTSDHGVTGSREQLLKSTPEHGVVSMKGIIDQVEETLEETLGDGRYVEALNGHNMNLYFTSGTYERLLKKPKILNKITQVILRTPGIRRVVGSEEAGTAARLADPLVRAAALGYFPGRSGDLILVLEPGWVSVAGVSAVHWSGSPDDQRVPVLFMGAGIKPGRYEEAITPADIAPTLAALCGIGMTGVEGHVLTSAIKK